MAVNYTLSSCGRYFRIHQGAWSCGFALRISCVNQCVVIVIHVLICSWEWDAGKRRNLLMKKVVRRKPMEERRRNTSTRQRCWEWWTLCISFQVCMLKSCCKTVNARLIMHWSNSRYYKVTASCVKYPLKLKETHQRLNTCVLGTHLNTCISHEWDDGTHSQCSWTHKDHGLWVPGTHNEANGLALNHLHLVVFWYLTMNHLGRCYSVVWEAQPWIAHWQITS